MVDREYSSGSYKVFEKVIIGTIIKNREMIRFVLDDLKTRNMRKNAVRKLPFLIRNIPDQYKTEQMCHKAVVENSGTVKFVLDNHKKMYNKAVDNYVHTL